ncbi:MAG: hypothetical protein CMH57_03490 [Myxococcales bacterium]|nr:hypothetical protein [Myxococcales bacterium]
MPERFELAAADMFWVPPEVEVIERPEITYTRSANPNPLYNAVARSRAGSLAEVRRLVSEVLAAHGGASRWRVFSHVEAPGLVDALTEAGYAKTHEHKLMVFPVERELGGREADPRWRVARIETVEQLLDCREVTERAFERPMPHASRERLEEELAGCADPDGRVARFVVYDRASGEAASAGGLTLDPRFGLGFLWAGGTVPEFQGQGAYSMLIRARLDHARAAGLSHVGLYARLDTSAPVVARRGFTCEGRMDWWERPAQS